MSIQGLIGRQTSFALPSLCDMHQKILLSLPPTWANKKRTTAYENLTTATKTKPRDETAPSPIEEGENRKKNHITNIEYQKNCPATSYTRLFIKLIFFFLFFLLRLLQVGMNTDNVRVNGIYLPLRNLPYLGTDYPYLPITSPVYIYSPAFILKVGSFFPS